MEKIKSLDGFSISEKTTVALGYFDGVHLGHQSIIDTAVREARENGYKVCVFSFMMRMPSERTKKGKEDITSLEDRMRFCEGLGVDYFIAPDFDTLKDMSYTDFINDILIEKLNVKEIICGPDYTFGKDALGNVEKLRESLSEKNVSVKTLKPFYLGETEVRSTKIREYIKDGDIESANRFLGRRYSYKTTVINGKKLGRLLGFPTINQTFREHELVPRKGVYASVVVIDENEFYPGATSIGVRPTVESDKKINSETYIIDFENRDLYGKEIRIIPVKFLRDEKHFASVDDLISAMDIDVEKTKKLVRPLIERKEELIY